MAKDHENCIELTLRCPRCKTYLQAERTMIAGEGGLRWIWVVGCGSNQCNYIYPKKFTSIYQLWTQFKARP